jgi:hypothetical protein
LEQFFGKLDHGGRNFHVPAEMAGVFPFAAIFIAPLGLSLHTKQIQ